ncbi:hypothetical protein Cantr_02417 [Candida viswanathii]|uniref:Uncharacterized protein n=1 Tax=Candida viswanathii TaxID=5486 RepID=A0A367YPX3_9ASCO|nr:hypothetical protein Cantr_02417 [Candida viswanathii]
MHGPRNLYNELHKLREDQHVANSHEPHTEEDDSEVENIENVIYSDDEAYYDDDDNGGPDRESRLKRDRELSQLMSASMTEDQLRRKYKQLEDESLRRFWKRNQEIFLKYSTIDDAMESDEIDLVTGEIVTNNGHLERLYGNGSSESGLKGNIWRTDYNRYLRDLESMYDVRKDTGKGKKKKDTRMIKKLDLFSGRLGRLEKDTSVMKFSPTKGKVPSGLDREESPTKKRRLGIEIYADESGEEDDDNVAYSESDEESYVESGTETPEIEGPLYDESEDEDEDDTGELYYESLIVNDRNKPLRSSKMDKTNLLPPEHDNAEPEHSRRVLSETQSIRESTPLLPPPPSSSETEDFPTSSSEEPQPVSRRKLSFDEEYHIIEDPILYLFPTTQEQEHPKSIKIYRCAFKKTCKYCTGNKKLYESHLLSLHSFQLYKLGYPISNPYQPTSSSSISSSEDKIDVDLIGLLTDFPQKLHLDLPRISYSCNTPLASSSTHQKCQKFYMTSQELEEHKMKLDDCSAKSLVLFCPILGCEYMTDCGYADWRTHMIEQGHAVPVPPIPGDTIVTAGTVKQEKRTRIALEVSRKVNVGVPKFKETDGRKVELKFIEAGSDPSIDELFN